jgi:hypothetical protein
MVQLFIRNIALPNKKIFDSILGRKTTEQSTNVAKAYKCLKTIPDAKSFVRPFVGRSVTERNGVHHCVDISVYNSLMEASNQQNTMYEQALRRIEELETHGVSDHAQRTSLEMAQRRIRMLESNLAVANRELAFLRGEHDEVLAELRGVPERSSATEDTLDSDSEEPSPPGYYFIPSEAAPPLPGHRGPASTSHTASTSSPRRRHYTPLSPMSRASPFSPQTPSRTIPGPFSPLPRQTLRRTNTGASPHASLVTAAQELLTPWGRLDQLNNVSNVALLDATEWRDSLAALPLDPLLKNAILSAWEMLAA